MSEEKGCAAKDCDIAEEKKLKDEGHDGAARCGSEGN
jgi:hypothetical protein